MQAILNDSAAQLAPQDTMGGGLVRFEGTMKFGVKKTEDKINVKKSSASSIP